MVGRLRQSAESFANGESGYVPHLSEGSSLDEFGQKRCAGNRSGAPSAQKLCLGNAPVFHAGRKLQHICANGIAHLDLGGRAREISRIARIPKMLQYLFTEHGNAPLQDSTPAPRTE